MLRVISGLIRLIGIGLMFPGTLVIRFGFWIRPEDQQFLFGRQDLEEMEPLKICYHGTDEQTAKKILKEGFLPHSYFAQHLEDALGFGGSHVFEVCFPKDTESAGSPWQFTYPDHIEPDLIVRCRRYEIEVLRDDKDLGKRILRSKMSPQWRQAYDEDGEEDSDPDGEKEVKKEEDEKGISQGR